jgi:UPF0716 protein FxsA
VAIFALLFIVLPLAEIYVAVQVSHVIGALNTVVLLALLSICGAWLTKFAGFGVINRIRQQLAAGNMPTNELIDGGLILTAGVLLIVPGFVTGVLGLLLLFPLTRGLARGTVKHRFQGRITYLGGSSDNGRLDGPDIIDV